MKKTILTSMMLLTMTSSAFAASPFMVSQSAPCNVVTDEHKTVVNKPTSTLAHSLIKSKVTMPAAETRDGTEQQVKFSSQSGQPAAQ